MAKAKTLVKRIQARVRRDSKLGMLLGHGTSRAAKRLPHTAAARKITADVIRERRRSR